MPDTATSKLELSGDGLMAVNLVYASLFEPEITRLLLTDPSPSHRGGPDYLNVLRVLDVPQAMAVAAERVMVSVYSHEETSGWEFPAGVASGLGWSKDQFDVLRLHSSDSLPFPKSR
jgi:hypothetical protein